MKFQQVVNRQNALEANKIRTSHILNIDGYVFQLTSEHFYAFRQGSKLQFTLWLVEENSAHGKLLRATDTIKGVALDLIKDFHTRAERTAYSHRLDGLSLVQVLAHNDFRYGRLILDGGGNCKYVNIYCTDKDSPTGVCLWGGCTEKEFEAAAAATGNSHNYLVGNEGRRVA